MKMERRGAISGRRTNPQNEKTADTEKSPVRSYNLVALTGSLTL
jgi:hypothetical protein